MLCIYFLLLVVTPLAGVAAMFLSSYTAKIRREENELIWGHFERRQAWMEQRRDPDCLTKEHWKNMTDAQTIERAASWLDFAELMQVSGDELALRSIRYTASGYLAAYQQCEDEEK